MKNVQMDPQKNVDMADKAKRDVVNELVSEEGSESVTSI